MYGAYNIIKTRQQLETKNAVKVRREWETHLEWEEANCQLVVDREVAVKVLSQEEIEWLND